MEYKNNNNVVYSCKYHVVWCPRYRRKVLVDGVDVVFCIHCGRCAIVGHQAVHRKPEECVRLRNGKSKRNHRQSYKSKCVGSNIKVLEGAVQLPKLGKVKCRISKPVEGRILSATVSRTPSGKYFVCAKVGLSVMRCFSRPRYQCRKDHFERRTAPAGVWLDVGRMPVILFCA